MLSIVIRICKHDVVQAEQCAWLVHNRGKCNIKSGKLTILRKMQNALTQNGLSRDRVINLFLVLYREMFFRLFHRHHWVLVQVLVNLLFGGCLLQEYNMEKTQYSMISK